VYNLQLGVVLYRAHHNDDHAVRNRALLVLAGNELWNVGFFGRRSPRNEFWGLLAFLGPLLALQRSVTSDPRHCRPDPYSLWVVASGLPWTYQLWRLNTDGSR